MSRRSSRDSHRTDPGRPASGPRWIHGVQPVLEALRSPRTSIEKIWVAYGRTGPALRRVLEQAEKRRVPVSFRDRPSLDRQAGGESHQGVLALCSPLELIDLQDFLDGLPADRPRFLALLDQVQDPHNLGAVIRTGSAAGVEGILLPRHGTCPVTPAVSKASAGAVEWMPLVRTGNAAQAVERLKAAGVWVLGADPEAETDLYEADLPLNLCVVLGGEGGGLRPGLRKQCDELVSIPMPGPMGSLNVSVAAGILLFEVVRQRRRSGPD